MELEKESLKRLMEIKSGAKGDLNKARMMLRIAVVLVGMLVDVVVESQVQHRYSWSASRVSKDEESSYHLGTRQTAKDKQERERESP